MRGTGLVPAGANPTARQNCACSPDQFVYCSTMATYCFHRQSRALANILSGADSPHGRGHVHLLPRWVPRASGPAGGASPADP